MIPHYSFRISQCKVDGLDVFFFLSLSGCLAPNVGRDRIWGHHPLSVILQQMFLLISI